MFFCNPLEPWGNCNIWTMQIMLFYSHSLHRYNKGANRKHDELLQFPLDTMNTQMHDLFVGFLFHKFK
jgi:hypothetical protein